MRPGESSVTSRQRRLLIAGSVYCLATAVFFLVASPEVVTFTVFGVINELPLWYRPGGRKRPAQLAIELADFVLAALGEN